MAVIRWGGRRDGGVASGGASTGVDPDSVDSSKKSIGSTVNPLVVRFSTSQAAFRRSVRATAVGALVMATSLGMVGMATAIPATGDDVLSGLDTVHAVSDNGPRDLPLDTSGLLSGVAAQPQTGALPATDLPLAGGIAGGERAPLDTLPLGGGGVPPLAQPNNTQTPGAYVSEPDRNATQFGEWSTDTSDGITEGSKTTFMADPRARDFNGSAGGWVGYQEYSPLCTVRGVGCVNWNFEHRNTDGPQGEGDGYLRTNGTSLGVAPCTPQNGKARWVSKQFTFNVKNALSWKIDFDARQTELLVGDGHSAFGFDILDDEGRVVTTAFGPQGTFPLNKWQHMSANFDGSEMAYGKRYRVSYWVDVVHAETALNLGNIDMDNIQLVVDCVPGAQVTVPCTVDGNLPGELGSLPPQGPPSLRPPDLCPTTVGIGQALAPVIDTAYCILDCTLLKGPMDKLRGVFIIGDLETGQFLGYLAGKEAVPSIDPRDLLLYLKDGTLGKLAGYVILFVGNTVELVKEILSDPLGTVNGVLSGQLVNVKELLANPGRLLNFSVPWTIADLTWVLQTLVNPPGTPQSILGGVVFRDVNKNGILDQGEPGVPNATVELVDETDNSYGTTTTDVNGRYIYTNLQPRFEPQSYRLVFTLPEGMTFTEQHVPGSIHENTSNPDQWTGKTDRITVTRGQVDTNWHAGAISGDGGNTPDPGQGSVDLCIGDRTVNGQTVTGQPGPTVAAGTPATLAVDVTNCGDVPVEKSQIVVDSKYGKFDCGQGELKPGETVTCTLVTTAEAGPQVVPVTVTVPNTDGTVVTKDCVIYYTNDCDCAEAVRTEEI